MTRRGAWAATAVVCSALFLIGLDFTVLNVAIPGLQRDLGPSMAETQWLVDGYALTLGACVLAAGTLSDSYGRRRAFLTGLALCAVASAGGALADSAAQVVAARCGMGLGAALFMPATLATIAHVFRGAAADRRRAMSLWAAVAGIGTLTGPVAGGWLVEDASWRAAFWLNVPVALAVFAAAVVFVPESTGPQPRPLDRAGALLSSGALLALVWGIIEAPGRGWLSRPVLAAFVTAAVLLVLFAWWQRRCPTPMLPLSVARNGAVRAAAVALALMSFAVFGAMFILTLYLQQVRGLGPWQAGLRITPLSVGLAIGAGAAALVSKRYGPRTAVTAGLVLIAAGCAVLAGDTQVLAFEGFAGFGAGLVAPSATETLMASVPEESSGLGSALNDASRQVGSTLGVAVLGSVLVTVSTGHSAPVTATGDAFVRGMTAAAWTAAAVTLAGAGLAWFRLPGADGAPGRAAEDAAWKTSAGSASVPDPQPVHGLAPKTVHHP
ncbi:MFS transporter [Streptomyces sp. RKAG337]|uniref:MFS transporter n=1 Tax=Streptomyces sp. RKAG337 TaxID=2893404 RepID=UPI0020346620|nr:MFS transporter [Streptomyces sp. RKAG337]MCM2424930.1 MFS transporter [Streptomyces sp. RKAG337]